MANGNCSRCDLIESAPKRDWPVDRMREVDLARNTMNFTQESLQCDDCLAEWRRRVIMSTGAVEWSLLR
ncbi:hypothetical protein [Pseudoxanthomonas wuyuanensis]